MPSTSPTDEVVCVYVFRGSEVCRKTQAHPGMDSFELEEYKHHRTDERVVFVWDHLNAKGEHVFRGESIRIGPKKAEVPAEKV